MPEHGHGMRNLVVTSTYFDTQKYLHGFVMQWFSGENSTLEFDVTTGAGMGGTEVFITVTDKATGRRWSEAVNFADVATQWVTRIYEDMQSENMETALEDEED